MADVSRLIVWCTRILGAVVVAVALTGCGAKVDLMSAIPESDANEVIAALLNAGISAEKVAGKEGMVGVRVDQAKVALAVDTLRAAGLPREAHIGMGQVFKKDGLISSPLEERARYLYALSQDISATLARIDGVLFARVHLVLPERGATAKDDLPSSAAVFIKHTAESDVELLQPQVRRMVANSIPGLATDRVTVVFVPSNVNSQPTTTGKTDTVLGIRVDAASAATLRAVLVAGLVLLLASLSGLGYLIWRFLWKPRQRQSGAGSKDAS